MRAGIGLLTLLIVAAVIFYLSYGGKNGGSVGQTLQKGQVAREEVSQFGGHDHPEDSIILEDDMAGNELRGLKVTGVTPGGPMDMAYGVKVGDEIVQANQLDLRGSDSGTAKAMVTEGYNRNQALVVKRNDLELTLRPKDTALSNERPDLFPKSVPTH